jgi:G8 domain
MGDSDKTPTALEKLFKRSTKRRDALRLFGSSAVSMSPVAFVACGGGGDSAEEGVVGARESALAAGDPTTFTLGLNSTNDVQLANYDIRLSDWQTAASTDNWCVIYGPSSVCLMRPSIVAGVNAHKPAGTVVSSVSDIRLRLYQTSTHPTPVSCTIYAVTQGHADNQETWTNASSTQAWSTPGAPRGAALGTITMGGAAGWKTSGNLSALFTDANAIANGIVIVSDGGPEWVAFRSADNTAEDGLRASFSITYVYAAAGQSQTFTLGINTGNTVQQAGYDIRLTAAQASSSTDNWSVICADQSVLLMQPNIVGAINAVKPQGSTVTGVSDLRLTIYQTTAHAVPVPCSVYAVAQAHTQSQETWANASNTQAWSAAGVPRGAKLGTIQLGGAVGFKTSSNLSAMYTDANALANGVVIVSDGGPEWVASSTSELGATDGYRSVFTVTYSYGVVNGSVQAWSNPATWGGGAIPGVGSAIGASAVVPAGTTVMVDTNIEVGTLDIQGKVVLDPSGTLRTIKYHTISVTGALEAGTQAAPFAGKALFRCIGAMPSGMTRGLSFIGNTATNNNGTTNDQNGVHRAVLVMGGGTLSMATPRKAHAVKLAADAAAGATTLLLSADPVGWVVGDQLSIDITSYFGTSPTEFLKIASISGRTIGFTMVDAEGQALTGGLRATRFGRLQYLTAAGAALAPAPVTAASLTGKVTAGTESASATYIANATGVPSTSSFVIDERATVVNLSRAIRFDCDFNDPAWTSAKDGGHIMWMSGAVVRLDGVELHRMGQRGLLGRYPLHAHMMSWNPATGAYIPHGTSKADQCVIQYCSVWNSANRAYVCHGTVGSRWTNNVAASGLGHLLFLEDGSEIENVFTGNVMMGARDPGNGLRIKAHDEAASGCWFANLYNTITNNVASDCIKGIWNAPAAIALGQSQSVVFDMGGGVGAGRSALHMKPILWKDNEAHGCREAHIETGSGPENQEGASGVFQYIPTVDGSGPPAYGYTAGDFFELDGARIWKAVRSCYANRVGIAIYKNFRIYSHIGHGLSGKTHEGARLERGLFVARTQNNPTETPSSAVLGTDFPNHTVGMAAYHWTVNLIDTVFFDYMSAQTLISNDNNNGNNGFGLAAAGMSAIGLWDSYLYPVQWGHLRNRNCAFVNSIPMYLLPPNHMQNVAPYTFPATTQWAGIPWALAGAMKDFLGWLHPTAAPDKWWVRDTPFFTYSATKTAARFSTLPNGGNGVMVDGPYYGIEPKWLDSANENIPPYMFTLALLVSRFATPPTGATAAAVGTWNIPAQTVAGAKFSNMRHFAAAKGGAYFIDTPTPTPAGNTQAAIWQVTGLVQATDFVYLGVEWSAAVVPQVVGTLRDMDWGATRMRTMTVAAMQSEVSHGYQERVFAQVASMAALTSATTSSYFRDTANNRVWVKAFGGYTGATPRGPTGQWIEETDPRIAGGRYGDYEMQSRPLHVGVCARV